MDKLKSFKRNIFEVFLYAFIYGLVSINYIDFFPKNMVIARWYHIWLIGQYFTPFIIIMLVFGIWEWEIVLALGLSVSLCNDLMYAPMGLLFGTWHGDLLEWYKWQLGFYGLSSKWIFEGGFLTFPVTSIVMGISIYIRFILVFLLVWKWMYHD